MGKIIHNGVTITREITVPSMITILGGNHDITTTTDSERSKIQFGSILAQTGNKLTFDNSNDEIVIGSGISYVSISCGCILQQKSSGMTYQNLEIYKNSTVINVAEVKQQYSPATYYAPTTLSELLISVQEGDRISCKIFNRVAGTINVSYQYLTVKAIA